MHRYIHMHEQHIRLNCTDSAVTWVVAVCIGSGLCGHEQCKCAHACVVKTLLRAARGKEPVCLLPFYQLWTTLQNTTSTQIHTSKVTYVRSKRHYSGIFPKRSLNWSTDRHNDTSDTLRHTHSFIWHNTLHFSTGKNHLPRHTQAVVCRQHVYHAYLFWAVTFPEQCTSTVCALSLPSNFNDNNACTLTHAHTHTHACTHARMHPCTHTHSCTLAYTPTW